jgi:putative heme-binding domain-containing protein
VALSCQDSDRTGPLLLEDWQAYSPQLRRDVTDALLSSLSRIEVLLQAVEKKSVQAGELERSTKQLLVNHSSPAVGERARRLFGGEVSPDRAAVIAEYQQVLDLEGDPGRGFETYKKKCSVCHRVGNAGFSVAPDLVSVQNKSAADLVVAILDPNRDAQPDFNTYNVLTENGRLYNGIIAGETTASVTLRRAEARQDVIFRKTIEEFTSTGISLMPEGLEKELSPQDLADVIAFVKSIPTAVAEVPVPK